MQLTGIVCTIHTLNLKKPQLNHTMSCEFTSHLRHSRKTHKFRYVSVAAAGALEYPKTKSRNDNKEELYFTLNAQKWEKVQCEAILLALSVKI